MLWGFISTEIIQRTYLDWTALKKYCPCLQKHDQIGCGFVKNETMKVKKTTTKKPLKNPKTKTHIKMENIWKLSKINVSASCPEAYSVDKSTGRLPSGRNSWLKIPLLNLESSRADSKSPKRNQSRVMRGGGAHLTSTCVSSHCSLCSSH